MASGELGGSCPCGAVRFAITAVFDARYCHCLDCRRATGAPASATAVVEPAHFRIVAGALDEERAPNGVRHRCRTCRTEVCYSFETSIGGLFSVPIGFLDDPDACPPRYHQFFSRRLRWFHVHDDLPKYAYGRVPHPERRR